MTDNTADPTNIDDQDSEPTMTAPSEGRPDGTSDSPTGPSQGGPHATDADDQTGAEEPTA
jgi:hypothetical protein